MRSANANLDQHKLDFYDLRYTQKGKRRFDKALARPNIRSIRLWHPSAAIAARGLDEVRKGLGPRMVLAVPSC
jgi:hypothetical protein